MSELDWTAIEKHRAELVARISVAKLNSEHDPFSGLFELAVAGAQLEMCHVLLAARKPTSKAPS